MKIGKKIKELRTKYNLTQEELANKYLDMFERVIKEGAYPNMRMLRNDIEDAINFEILKARGIIQ